MNDILQENWVDIKDWEGSYQVSNMGRVRSLDRIIRKQPLKGKILNTTFNNDGFLYVSLCRNQTRTKYLVLQLVGRHFIKDLKGFRCFKHKNSDKTDNRVSNIEFDETNVDFYEGFRICVTCKAKKPLSDFYHCKDRVRRPCIECDKLNRKEIYRENPELILNRAKEYYNIHKGARASYRKVYYQENKKEINRKNNEQNKIRLKTDPCYKARRVYKNRLSCALKRQNVSKNNRKSLDFLGCSWEEFKGHIESQFDSSMTWENHGKVWHFGHILPCELFDLTKEHEVKVCFNYSNIRPENGLENVTKQDFLKNGLRARDLESQEKVSYLESEGVIF